MMGQVILSRSLRSMDKVSYSLVMDLPKENDSLLCAGGGYLCLTEDLLSANPFLMALPQEFLRNSA